MHDNKYVISMCVKHVFEHKFRIVESPRQVLYKNLKITIACIYQT